MSCGINLFPPLSPSENGWKSLIEESKNPKNAAREVLCEYEARLSDPLFLHVKRKSILQDVIGDLYMKYVILNKKEKIQDLIQLTVFFEGNSRLIFQINKIFSVTFDPYWKLTQCIVHYKIASGKTTGEKVMTEWNKYPFLRYRRIHSLNAAKAERNQDSLTEVRAASRDQLDYTNPSFKKRAYYFTLLNYHPHLIEFLSAKYTKKCSVEKEEESTHSDRSPAQQLSHQLLSPKTRKTISRLDRIKQSANVQEIDCFPRIGEPAAATSHAFIFLPTIPESTEKESQFFAEMITKLTLSGSIPLGSLSSFHLKTSIPTILQILKWKHTGNRTDLIQDLCKLCRSIYNRQPNPEALTSILQSIAIEINLIQEEFCSYSLHTEENSWDKFFEGTLDPKQKSCFITDLNMECARLFRMLNPIDLNPELNHYGVAESHRESAAAPMESLSIFFNQLSSFLVYRIISAETDKQALGIVKNCIALAEEMLAPPIINAHVACAILSALNNVAVSRLHQLFKKLDKESLKALENLEMLFNPEKNYKNYKEMVENTEFPVIPYFGFYSRDFTFATEHESTREQQQVVLNLLNRFYKTRILIKMTVPIKRYSTDGVESCYSFALKPNPSIDNQLYRISIDRWPPSRPPSGVFVDS